MVVDFGFDIFCLDARAGMHAAREEDAVAYMTQFDQVDMMGIEFPPYEEPPPPYTPPKPPDYMNGEAPPPYTPENNNNEGEGRIPLRPGKCGGNKGVLIQSETFRNCFIVLV